MAWLRTLKNQTTLLLICGRRSLLTAYKDWLQERDVELDISAEAALQAALAEDGIPFRTGGRDTTWKYKLSPADKPLPVWVSLSMTCFRCSNSMNQHRE